ncbi:glycosyltransferase [Streptomyces sp. H10-C2]|uniref:glycosyltransferase n=1 Tax=unclassified Streptomyces TaxID=2593676 RepID=UPI0024BA8F83|nr:MULTISPECIES: glycosyltransferase [unclassified Streptomyces]MDJ0340342.1 glycosyltransferase [Streptomyces sp. PH10-H1]MDJ0368210.1 glycosyltransferase [Streptomyces sp. H10-C2]
MKVLHIITGLGVGGAEQQLRLLLRHLPLSCEVITLTHPGPVADGIRADGTPVTHLGMTGNRDLTALPRLTRLIRAGRYDIVHTHLYRACVYGRIAARLAGVRTVVATEHSLGDTLIEGRPLTRGTRALYRGTEKLGTATVAVSGTVAQRLRAWGIPGPRIHTVPNGIDAGAFRFDAAVRAATRARLGLPPDAFVVGGVGRLVPGKRFDLLVRAVADRPGARLLLAGTGPEHDALLRLAGTLGAADRIHLPGAAEGPGDTRAQSGACERGDGDGTPGIAALLAAMDLFVSPSNEETFGLAVLEALAAGLPVLYAACPALDDLPPSHAPGARRVNADTGALGSALRQHQEAGPHRLPVPAAVGHYDIAGTADRLAALYALAAARP